jgi:hypothetical protein
METPGIDHGARRIVAWPADISREIVFAAGAPINFTIRPKPIAFCNWLYPDQTGAILQAVF